MLRLVVFVQVLLCAVSHQLPAASHDNILGLDGPSSATAGIRLSKESLHTVQGFAVAQALTDPTCDIIRCRFVAQHIDRRSLEAAGIAVPHLAIEDVLGSGTTNRMVINLEDADGSSTAIGIFIDAEAEEEQAERYRRAGWEWRCLFSAWQRPQMSLVLAQSIKTRSPRPTCLVRLLHEEQIPTKSSGCFQLSEDDPFHYYWEREVLGLDPFYTYLSANAADDYEYILLVQQAPEDHPLVQRLRKILGPDWDIRMQMLPDGRPGLATLAMSGWWAAIRTLGQDPRRAALQQEILGGWHSIFSQRERESAHALDGHESQFQPYLMPRYPALKSSDLHALVSLPHGLRVAVPSHFVYGSMDDMWTGLTQLHQPPPNSDSQHPTALILDHARTFLRDAQRPPGWDVLREQYLPSFSSLPLPITRKRLNYPIPNDMTPEAWEALVRASPWANAFKPDAPLPPSAVDSPAQAP